MDEVCGICGCRLHRDGGYATPGVKGRSHATKHHYVAERFFGRSANRKGETRERISSACPWGCEGQSEVYCYDCHEVLLHNPVLLRGDIALLRQLVVERGLNEIDKTEGYSKLAGRIELLHEIIQAGLQVVSKAEKAI